MPTDETQAGPGPKTFAVTVQIVREVMVFPDATSPQEAEHLAREQWAELTTYDDDQSLPFAFDADTMSITKVREMTY